TETAMSILWEEATSGVNEQVSDQIEEDVVNTVVHPVLQPEVPNADLHPGLSYFIGIPIVDSSTVQPSSNNSKYSRLLKAARRGNWKEANKLIEDDQQLLTSGITIELETALMIAVDKKQWMFAEEIVKLMPPEALELQETRYGNTALHMAASKGNKKMTEAIVKRNPKVTLIRNKKDAVPLLTASVSFSQGQKEIIEYLWAVTSDEEPSPLAGPDGASVLCNVINANFYDTALLLIKRFPGLVTEKTKNIKIWPLEAIAKRPFTFRSGSKLNLVHQCIYPLIQVEMNIPNRFNSDSSGDIENPSECSRVDRGIISKFCSITLAHLAQVPSINKLFRQKLMHEEATGLVNDMIGQLKKMAIPQAISFFENSCVLKTAIKYGTIEIVKECLLNFPYLIWIKTENKTLLQIAIEERNEKVLELIFETCDEDDKNELLSRRDANDNGVLHFAANLAPSAQLNLASGAALQMQKEIQWFKGVENIVKKSDRLARNKDGNTAQLIFTKEHSGLRKEGEKWMRETSHSCMVVSTLIATVAFAAAFTVPGGNFSDANNNNNGIPIFLNKISFIVFAIADALALFSSITSVHMFLAILTSRYAEDDFLTALPIKLIIGLGTLFFSIVATMVAFGATLSIVLGHKIPWVVIPITLFACVPVTLFAFLQFPLLVEMVRSTYRPNMFRS
ncbi:hypothetical protein MKX03_022978, partial [Papaver bracteatum]